MIKGGHMEVHLSSITGIDDALVSLTMSHHTWSESLDYHIRKLCRNVLTPLGGLKKYDDHLADEFEEFHQRFEKLLKWGCQHITLLRFIDFSIIVNGLHRAGQDDWDSHAKRFDNRIIRNSTRTTMHDFKYDVSSYYRDKVIPTDVAMQQLGIQLPETISHNGKVYLKSVNGYILEDEKDNPDVKRGLYMLGMPSDFIFKVNLTEWAHVYKMRNAETSAHPEVRECCEMIADLLGQTHKEFSRELFLKIMN